jgi:ubiquinone/menaquinone biosynthesis C-methylase UbiE
MTLQRDPERNESKHLHAFAHFTKKRVLEIGCGEGRLTWQYAWMTHGVAAIDPNWDALRVAQIDRPSDLTGKVHFLLAESEQLPFTRESFDLALLAWSF